MPKSLRPPLGMVRSFIRSWGALYDMLGFHEADDPESARSIIVTSIAQRNVNLLLESSNSYVHILLNTYFTSDYVRHELEVFQRLGGVLPSSFVEGLSIEVIEPIPRLTSHPAALAVPRPAYELADTSWEPPAIQTSVSLRTYDGPSASWAACEGSSGYQSTHYEMHYDNKLFRVKAVCRSCYQTTWSQFGVGNTPYDELANLGWYKHHYWRKTWCPDCCRRYYDAPQEPAHEPSLPA